MARILIMDDDSVTRMTLGTLLRAGEHEVQYAADGDVGLKLYNRGSFDLCIIDLVMPNKDGLQAIKEIRARDSNARIIAVTGTSPEKLDMARELGAMRTLTKPVDPGELRRAVDDGLGE